MRRYRVFLAMIVAAASLLTVGCAEAAPAESADRVGLRVALILESTRDALGESYFSYWNFGPSRCQLGDDGWDGVYWKVIIQRNDAEALTDERLQNLVEAWEHLGLEVDVTDIGGLNDGLLQVHGTSADRDVANIEAYVDVSQHGGGAHAEISSECVPGAVDDFPGQD